MTTTTPQDDGHRPDEDSPRRGGDPAPADVLDSAAAALTVLEASDSARVVLAQVLSATLAAFTRTRAVRDPLTDTAAGTAEESLAVLAGIEQLRSSLAALDATWQVAAEQRIRQEDARQGVPSSAQGRGANGEIALARRVSPAASSFSLAAARRLVQHMPGTVESLWEGSVTAPHASTVAGGLSTARPETCARIDALIRQDPQTLDGKGHKRLRSDIEQMVQRLEPETSRERAERAARKRHVTMTPLADGMARVTAILRGLDAVGMMQVLHRDAESLRAAGRRDGVAALEADLLVYAVQHRPAAAPATAEPAPGTTPAEPAPGPPSAASPPTLAPSAPPAPPAPRTAPGIDVGIILTDTALLGPEDDSQCAHLEGYGILPAHIVRDTLQGRPPGHLRDGTEEHPDQEVTAFYRRVYRSPRTGELVSMESRSRAFPTGLARMIRWRDTTCRTPWCNARIRQSDHVTPHHRGGPTSYANGQGLCVRCNLLKEQGLWVLAPLTGHEKGVLRDDESPPTAPPSAALPSSPGKPPPAWHWTSPHGARGLSWTPRLLHPNPSADDGEANGDVEAGGGGEAGGDDGSARDDEAHGPEG